ncbi:DUF5313 family protein [Nocardia sp. 2]|uniref:DUF5313 family protein n=1 Tax=Nocardia acididurans TaxID=2802282 RepID=A0ABS1M7D5_9NOCA|nr:DUF5313 family protein [Nocardia acididurans]MBL1076563.1 DUF5313 family protein [Nocardia acididurans]
MTSTTRRRPTPLQWLGYACGRRLPDSMQDWVRNDLTGKHNYARHLIRGMAPFTPLFVAFMSFPGALWLRCAMTLLALILALFYCSAYRDLNRAHRLVQHGLPADLESPARMREHALERAVYAANHPH